MEIVKMSPIKVGLVQINTTFSNSYYFPYSVGLLQAYFQKYAKHPNAFEFLDPIFSRMFVDKIVTQLEEAEIVAFSTCAWNSMISLDIAKRLKKKNPDVLISFGGPHVPDKAEKFLRTHLFIDMACHGEGEKIFTEILDNYHSRNWGNVPSISYLDNGNYIQNPIASRIKDLSSIPSPYLEGVFDNLMHHNPQHQWTVLWETNRGCPFTCAFCDWGSYTKSKLYAFDIERLEKEIEWFAKNEIEFIYCCDANFGILERDLDIAKYVAESKKNYGYPKAMAVHDTKNATERTYAIQKILHEAGLSKGASLALQTVDETTLKNIGRRNISLKSFRDLQRKFNCDYIETYTDILLGLPGETYNSFTRGVSQIIEMGQHNRIRFGTLFILPNAPMGDPQYQKEHGIIVVESENRTAHSSYNDSEDEIKEIQPLVVGTKTMPKRDWIKTKVFSRWCSFLHFDKILQLPTLLLHEICGCSYKEMFEAFFVENATYPIISEIQKFFCERARNIQSGMGDECCRSIEWLNLCWPPDEYVFIKLMVENKLKEFYVEAENILCKYLQSQGLDIPHFLSEAIMFNRCLIKRPFQKEDMVLQTEYNIWESYMAALAMEKIDLKRDRYVYRIDRTSEIWTTWDEWFREVVWYGNKQGAYLYRAKSV